MSPVEPLPKLLLIDDNVASSLALKSLIHNSTRWGVLVASSIEEARECLIEEPEAVLLDLNLPDGHGEDLIEEIRARSPKTRIIVLTAMVDGGPRWKRIRELAPDCIIKIPYDIDELIEIVKGHCPEDLLNMGVTSDAEVSHGS